MPTYWLVLVPSSQYYYIIGNELLTSLSLSIHKGFNEDLPSLFAGFAVHIFSHKTPPHCGSHAGGLEVDFVINFYTKISFLIKLLIVWSVCNQLCVILIRFLVVFGINFSSLATTCDILALSTQAASYTAEVLEVQSGLLMLENHHILEARSLTMQVPMKGIKWCSVEDSCLLLYHPKWQPPCILQLHSTIPKAGRTKFRIMYEHSVNGQP